VIYSTVTLLYTKCLVSLLIGLDVVIFNICYSWPVMLSMIYVIGEDKLKLACSYLLTENDKMITLLNAEWSTGVI